MPRSRIDIPDIIEYLSILDEDGHLDSELEPEIPDDALMRMYHYMLQGRRFDARLLNLQRQGRIGTFPPITGQEAAHLGAVAALTPSDWMAPAFRETAAELWRGRTLESVIIANNGFAEGNRIDADRNDLPISIPIASQILHAVGLGWAMKYRRTDAVAMTFFGDGATSEGDFHEALNFAGVFEVPVIFVCQNNHWAISVPRSRQTRPPTIAQKAIAYGIRGIQVDGNDILAVYQAATEAVGRARQGGGATLIEAVTYRMMMHTTADDPKKYRSDEEVAVWQRRDPLTRFQRYLTDKGLLDGDRAAAIEAEVMDAIQKAVDAAEARMAPMGDPLDMFEHTYAEMTPHLKAQRAYLAGELKGGRHG